MDPISLTEDRSDRIVDSLRLQILDCEGEQSLRIRQIFRDPKEIYRVEKARVGTFAGIAYDDYPLASENAHGGRDDR